MLYANQLRQNADLNRRKEAKPLELSGMAKIKSLMIVQWK